MERKEAAETLREKSHASCVTPTQLQAIMNTFKTEMLEQISSELNEKHSSVIKAIGDMSISLNDVCQKIQSSDNQISKDIKRLSHIVDVSHYFII
jgi:ABC-type transporter Mla subunit MlaD